MPEKSSFHRPRADLVLCALACAAATRADDGARGPFSRWDPNQYALELGAEMFRWQEFDDDGKRLLTEQGPRLSLGVRMHNLTRADDGLVYELGGGAFGGEINYDGQDTEHTYVSSDSRYAGWRAEARGGYRFGGEHRVYAVDLMAGLGTERWRRDIQNSRNALGFPVAGFAENYAVDYARASVGLAHRLYHADAYLDLGMRLPLGIDEDVRVDGQPITLHPEKRVAPYVSYKVSLDTSRRGEPFGTYVEAFYSGFRFGKSPTRTTSSMLVWQPKTTEDVIGLALGLSY